MSHELQFLIKNCKDFGALVPDLLSIFVNQYNMFGALVEPRRGLC